MLASVALHNAYTDFWLSRQAIQCSPSTLRFYGFTAGAFLQWLESQGVTSPEQVSARLVRQYIAGLREEGKKDTTIHGHARAIKTLLRFWHAEGYLPEVVKFDMPKLDDKRLPYLDATQLEKVIQACDNLRDKAIIMLLADSGLRRAELIALSWGDVDMHTGHVLVRRGKGGKSRAAFICAKTRRALLAYKRTLRYCEDRHALFQTQHEMRFRKSGMQSLFYRLSQKTGIHVTPHALRRTFATLARRAGMDPVMIQAQLGHSTSDMNNKYISWVDDDLEKAHRSSSPIDNLSRLKKL